MRRSQSNPKKRSRIEKTQLNMPVTPDLRRNERQISDEKNAKSQSIRLRSCTIIGLRSCVLSKVRLRSCYNKRPLCASGGDERRSHEHQPAKRGCIACAHR
eukprot:scaffold9546_cov98-Isochrysis_galbana.AAC.1